MRNLFKNSIYFSFIFLTQFPSFGYAESLRLGCWNIHNYLTQHRWIEGNFKAYYPKPESEKEALRLQIRENDLDLLFVQEIGSLNHLKELQRDLRNEGDHFPYLYSTHDSGNRCLGILSKIPLLEIIEHSNWTFTYRGESAKMSRTPLEWRIEWQGRSIRFMGVHLKSRYTEFDEDPLGSERRSLECSAMINYLSSIEVTDSVQIIWGDFNAPPNDPSLVSIKKWGHPKHFTRLNPIDIDGESWTYEYWKTKTREAIDHIWIRHIEGKVLTQATISDENSGASDHRLIIIEIDFP